MAQVVLGGSTAEKLGFLTTILTKSVEFAEADWVRRPEAGSWLVMIILSSVLAPLTEQKANATCCAGIEGKSIEHALKRISEAPLNFWLDVLNVAPDERSADVIEASSILSDVTELSARSTKHGLMIFDGKTKKYTLTKKGTQFLDLYLKMERLIRTWVLKILARYIESLFS